MIKAHKIKLNPTTEQEQYFWQAAGVARYSFNWALAACNKRMEQGEKLKFRGKGPCLIKEFVVFKNEHAPWVSEVTTWAYQGAFMDAEKAVSNYFTKKKKGYVKLLPGTDKKRANVNTSVGIVGQPTSVGQGKNGTLNKPAKTKPRKDGKPFGWPRFKSRNRTTPSFYIANIALKLDGHFVQFDKKRVGWINMTETLRFDGKVMGVRISYRNGHWWLSVQVEVDCEIPAPKPNTVGVDLGIKYLGVTSDGVLYENPKALYKEEKRLRRLQRKFDRQNRANNPDNFNENGTVKQGTKLEWAMSNKMKRTKAAITKLHARIANIRKDAAHKMTTDIATTYGIIGLENLNIKGMMQNRRLSKAIADAGMYEKRRQLEYKAVWNGGIVVPVGRWFASSKICSGCGEINVELTLSTRKWICNNCSKINHRDGNAAINIRNETLRLLSDNQQAVKVLPGSDVKRAGANV